MSNFTLNSLQNFIKTVVNKKSMTLKKLNPEEKNIILGIASLSIPKNQELSEVAVNEYLLSWLNTEGEMLKIDYIELRRTLIDHQFWIRDKFGTTYLLKDLDETHPAKIIIEHLNAMDIHQYIQNIKAEYTLESLERKSHFQQLRKV